LRSADRLPSRRDAQRARAPGAIHRIAFALTIFLACVCATPALTQNLQPDDQPNIVQGTVVDAVTHNPIGRALVYSPDNRYATLTNAEGHFEFALPKPDAEGSEGQPHNSRPTFLNARKPGFLDDPRERKNVTIFPGTEVKIPLMPEALIKGRITLPAGESDHGISVELFIRQVQDGMPRWMHRGTVHTNLSGEFRFADLPPGAYKVLTAEWMDNDPITTVPGGQLYCFPPVYYPSATDFASASTIQLAAGQTFQADLSLVRHPYYPVKIPVTNTEAGGGMNVTVSPQGQRGPGYSLGYNAGKETIEGQLPNGKYLVEAAAFGQMPASGSVNLVVAGASAEGPSMVITRNNSIAVKVKEEFTSNDGPNSMSWSDGRRTFSLHGPRADLNIRADAIDDFGSQRSGSLRQPTGPDDDALILENMAPGRYWLRLTANHGYVASATMGGTDLLREPLVVVPGASTPIDITLRDDNAELDGTLLGVTPAPVEAGRWSTAGFVYCIPLPDSSGQFLEIPASYDGKFNHPVVTPGVYRVIAFDSQQHDFPYRDGEAMKVYESKGQIVHFTPGQKVTLQLEIISSAE
jgi:hypothetical protein